MTPVGSGFADRLRSAVEQRGRLCAGIDPHPELLEAWGLPRSPDGLAQFTDVCVRALGPSVAVVKPQVAMFEEYGSAGLAVLEDALARLHEAGALTLADAKRGDIGSTMAAYARAWLSDGAPLAADAVTAAPYLGLGALAPAVEQARGTGRGVFVLARTSNPEGHAVQTAQLAGGAASAAGTTVAQSIVDGAAEDATGTVGLVVGATRAHGLRLDGFAGPILAPGLGAQGASAADLPGIFSGAAGLLIPNSSRAILRAGPDAERVRTAAERTRDEIEAALR
ncbi:orotidine-5'-phosphate decarboxylase [Tomitella fengzijianii]|uniref:Orotidine 5'-phosphate decarboxylase n=1 Tax=Tomitella fengzijianii TaxID=2597660 RepID=A0A516X2Z9_9ACTN|nr:orotidine-5'-phosphate decarboxylase [Tomitella fengzijianii]QDQ97459.1 orotidine-5'-phosphate decarboxylase [Tomitella fengzijianii]